MLRRRCDFAAGAIWIGPYRLLELIEEGIAPRTPQDRGWASATDIRAFKRTANSVAAAGDVGEKDGTGRSDYADCISAKSLTHKGFRSQLGIIRGSG